MTRSIDRSALDGALPELDEAGVERMQRTVMGGVAQRVARRRNRRALLLTGAGVLAAVLIASAVVGNQPRGLITADGGWSGGSMPEYAETDSAPGNNWFNGEPPIAVDMTSEGAGRYSSNGSPGSIGAIAPGRPGELTPVPPTDPSRSVISKALVRVRVNDVPDAAQATIAHTAALGGFVETRNQRGEGSANSTATLTLRVPATQLEALIEGLDELGTVLEISTSDDDVTLTVRDLDARIKALRTSIERLQELLGQSASVSDLLEAETQLSQRQQELESLLSQQAYYAEQISMATVQVQLQPSDAPAELEPEGFWGGLLIGWNALVVALGGIITGLGVLLPWLAVIGAAVLLIWLVVALRRRGRRARHTSRQAAQTLPETAE